MKRFTLILSLMVAMVTTAMAQITSLNELGNDKTYVIQSSRCWLAYHEANPTTLCTTNANNWEGNLEATNENLQFKILNEEGAYYLFSVAANKYVTKNGSFSDTKDGALSLTEQDGEYKWLLTIGGNGLNTQIPGQYAEGIVVNSWANADQGNTFKIIDIATYVEDVHVSALKDFKQNKCYTITTSSRGAWSVTDDLTQFQTTGYASQSVDKTNTKQHFAVLSADDENYYLFNVAAEKFVKQDRSLVAGIADAIVLHDASSVGASRVMIQFKGKSNGYVNIGGNGDPAINGWGASAGQLDGGNAVLFTEVGDFDPTAALAMLSNVAEVTYNFVCNDVTLATQTATVSKGEEFPAFNVTLPLGYRIAEEKPAGTVTATVSEEITVVVDNSLLPFEAVAEGTPSKWYYAQMHAYGGYHWFIAPKDGAVATQDHKFTADEVDAHLWGFVGTVEGGFKMVNKASGKAIKSANEGVAAMAEVADATAFIAMGSQAGGKWFCMKNPEGNYLNSQGSASATDFVINHWRDNDNGSSFKLTEYVNEGVTVAVSNLKWATKYFGESVHVPAGVEAYIITGAADGYVTKEQITEGEVIPANTGVLLYSEGEAEYVFAKTVSEYYTLANNLMNGSVNDTYVEGTAYVLANDNKGVGFYKAELNKNAEGNEGTTHFKNNAGKAYLVLPAAENSAAYYGFDWAGTTGVEDVVVENEVKAIYDLTGRRVEAITAAGIYIVNGKKVLVK